MEGNIGVLYSTNEQHKTLSAARLCRDIEDTMNNLGFGITHDKVLNILDSISIHVKKKLEELGYYLPLSMVKEVP